jgi:hypothetical protein
MNIPQDKFIIINSSLLYTIAFISAFYINELGLVFVGYLLNLSPVLYHNTITYTNLTSKFEFASLAAGPLSSLLLGIAALIVYKFYKSLKGELKLFFIWLYIHGFTLFLSQIMNIPFHKTSDMAKAVDAFGIPDSIQIIGSIISIVGIVLLGFLSAKPFLQFAKINNLEYNGLEESRFIQSIALYPWVLGAIMALPFRFPPVNLIYIILPITNGMTVVWTFVGAKYVKIGGELNDQLKRKILFPAVIILISLLLVVHLFFRNGISIS